MQDLREYGKKILGLVWVNRDPFGSAVRKAHVALRRVAGTGVGVADDISGPILRAGDAINRGNVAPEIEQAFYSACAKLAKLTPHDIDGDDDEASENPLKDGLDDAELLLKFGAETGVEVAPDIVEPILLARTAYQSGEVPDKVRAGFYSGYSRLSRLFGDVTADTIRNCSSPETRKTLARDRVRAVSITVAIATISVLIFVADSMSKGILEDISAANASAVTLRASLTPSGTNATIDPIYAKEDPCGLLATPPPAAARTAQNATDIERLQMLAMTVRDLLGKSIKLNWFVLRWESDPLGSNGIFGQGDKEVLNRQLELNPAILNYPAEVLCKIKTYQGVRTFASNVQTDYAAIVGAVASYALPIVYALLGAYAFRLRMFGETIRKRTYHPSFSDSARMITAVIAGAIAGLFNPAQSLSLSPLATAFLIGYGVELFFKFLDTLINAFGSPSVPGRRSA